MTKTRKSTTTYITTASMYAVEMTSSSWVLPVRQMRPKITQWIPGNKKIQCNCFIIYYCCFYFTKYWINFTVRVLLNSFVTWSVFEVIWSITLSILVISLCRNKPNIIDYFFISHVTFVYFSHRNVICFTCNIHAVLHVE